MTDFPPLREPEPPLGEPWKEAFRTRLLGWFSRGAREYPWRGVGDPYAVLVSEAMLQQTRIATVLGRGYYVRWMERFPDWSSLADAGEEEVLKVWEGLGYYSRARNLQRTARAIVEGHGGNFPTGWEEALALPGVGRYTAGAVLSIACGLRFSVVDGNVARVLARVFALKDAVNGGPGARRLQAWADELVPPDRPGDFNAGLMELGQRVCLPRKPDCVACPLAGGCQARADGAVDAFPAKKPAAKITRTEEAVVLCRRQGLVYLCQESGPRRRGLWRLPPVEGDAAADLEEWFSFEYSITRFRVRLRVYLPAPGWREPRIAGEGGGWFPLADTSRWPPLGAPYLKALERALTAGG